MATTIGQRMQLARRARGWSQSRLAERAGVSRALVSAIEQNRLTPSVKAAIGLAQALGCSVETLFGDDEGDGGSGMTPEWAWTGAADGAAGSGERRFWSAEVAGREWRYPAEPTGMGVVAHHGLGADRGANRGSTKEVPGRCRAGEVLVVATCDPAVGILATEFARQSGFQLLPLVRSSRQALALLSAGKVHAAGVHLASARAANGNVPAVRRECGSGIRLVRVGVWQEGVAFAPRMKLSSVRAAARGRTRWVGRQPGSGARACMDRLLDGGPAPRRIAEDHRGVALAIKSGWADAGVCLRIASEEAGLGFLEVQKEPYDLCFAESQEDDPRLRALVQTIQSPAFRRLVGDLPGYDARTTGSLASC